MFDGEFDRLGVVRHLDGIIGRDYLAERGGRPPFRQAGQVDGRLGGSPPTQHTVGLRLHGHHMARTLEIGGDGGGRSQCRDGPGAIARRDSGAGAANVDRHAMRGVSVTHGRQVQSLAFGARQRDAQITRGVPDRKGNQPRRRGLGGEDEIAIAIGVAGQDHGVTARHRRDRTTYPHIGRLHRDSNRRNRLP